MNDLLTLKRHLPYKGKVGSQNKKIAPCPHCGAPAAYRYPPKGTGRWKHCYQCGYDRLSEMFLETVRGYLRRGQPIPGNQEAIARAYAEQVYNLPSNPPLNRTAGEAGAEPDNSESPASQ